MKLYKRFIGGVVIGLIWLGTYDPVYSQMPDASGETYQQAVNSYQKGEYHAALDQCKLILAKQPDHWQAMQLAGFSSYKLGDTSTAINFGRRSLIFHPENPPLEAFLNRISPTSAAALQVPPPPKENFTSPVNGPASPVHFGFELGGNLATLSYPSQGNSIQGLERRFGFTGGLAMRVDLSPVFSLQPEILYAQKGVKYNYTYTYYDYTLGYVQYQYRITVALDYLELPILLRASIPSDGARPYFFAGMTLGVNVNASVTDDVSKVTIPYPSNTINSFESAVILGMGLDLGRFSISGRFEQGLTDISGSNYGSTQVNNQVINLMVGFFPI